MGALLGEVFERNGAQCQLAQNRIMCYDAEAQPDKQYFLLLPSGKKDYAQPFARILERLGGKRVFGLPLEPPRIEQGIISQAYQTVVILAPEGEIKRIHFLEIEKGRPGTKQTALVKQKYGQAEKMVFYPIEGEYGHHVPIFFDEFIAMHGGTELSGQPISEPQYIDLDGKRGARQCFENYCLDFVPGVPFDKAVRLVQLGKRGEIAGPPDDNLTSYLPAFSIIFGIGSPSVHSDEAQTVVYKVGNQNESSMVADIPIQIEMRLPNGEALTYDAPPTNEDGIGEAVIPPLPGAEHSMQVVCTVCIVVNSGDKVCRSDVYLIWDY